MNLTRNDVDWKSLLIKKYQSYGLDELDTMVIFVSDAVLSIQENTLLTCDILSPYMKATKDVIDQSLSKLMSKKYLTIVRKGNSFFSSYLVVHRNTAEVFPFLPLFPAEAYI